MERTAGMIKESITAELQALEEKGLKKVQLQSFVRGIDLTQAIQALREIITLLWCTVFSLNTIWCKRKPKDRSECTWPAHNTPKGTLHLALHIAASTLRIESPVCTAFRTGIIIHISVWHTSFLQPSVATASMSCAKLVIL